MSEPAPSPQPPWGPVDPNEYDEHQRALHDRLTRSRGRDQVESPDGTLRAAYALMVLEPTVGGRLEALGARLRVDSRVPADLRELAILCVAGTVGSRIQWSMHLPIARAAGIGPEEVDDEPSPPTLSDELRATVWRLVSAWLADRSGDSADRRLLLDRLGAPAVYELVTTVGYYRLLACQLTVFGLGEG